MIFLDIAINLFGIIACLLLLAILMAILKGIRIAFFERK
ncbi:Uncharacterised protein [Streptococcus uberis]|nr:Uncharacterised protein [Streptococcus uberis]